MFQKIQMMNKFSRGNLPASSNFPREYPDYEKQAMKIKQQKSLFQAKKLSLVLDLDHTLIHSIKLAEIKTAHQQMLKKLERRDQKKAQKDLFSLPHLELWVKLRPGIWSFLEKASRLYELHICTMRTEIYAMEMAKLLDPSGKLFGGRVVSKSGNGIKDLGGVLGMESTAIIMDDTARVWPNHGKNLIQVDKYMYFPYTKCKSKFPESSLFELQCDEGSENGVLESLMGVIERIHKCFYSNASLDEVDVRCILEEEKRNVLAGCCILFSEILPVDRVEPEQQPMWQAAVEFGAVCTTVMDCCVTHVVSLERTTREVEWAVATGRFVVSPRWIEASEFLYHKANENDFAVI